MAQKLSPEASAAKKKRDIEYAKSPIRKKRKRENQRFRRNKKKKGFSLKNKDVHHCPDGSLQLMSVKDNRNVWKHKERT